MKTSGLLAIGALAATLMGASAAQALTLGGFTFDDAKFGDTLSQSDGGAFAAANWVNVVDVDPGSPGYLTGANVDTGIANIGLGGNPVYQIGYTGGIANGAGDDIGIITARFSTADSITISFSTDGINFGGALVLGPGLGVGTGVTKGYFYRGGGPFGADLFVTPVNLSDFGIAAGSSIMAARITGSPELDLIRVAGLAGGGGGVPEPATWALMIGGFGLAGAALRRRRAATA